MASFSAHDGADDGAAAPPRKRAALLIAHGSRRDEANRDLVQVAHALRSRAIVPIVEIAYLELAEPTILQAGEACVAKGATSVCLLPYFLSAGRHAAEDLEALRRRLAERFPQVTFALAPPLSPHPLLIDILVERLGNGLPNG